MTRSLLRRSLLASVLFFTATPSVAQVAPAYYQVGVNAGSDSDFRTGETPRNIAIDRSDSGSFINPTTGAGFSWTRQQRAHAETYGGSSPQAVATAEAKITSTSATEGPLAYANANAFVSYFMHLNPVTTTGLVWQPAQIPVTFTASAEVTGAASATVGVANVNTGQGLFLGQASNFDPPIPGFTRTAHFSIGRDHYVRVSLSASAQASDSPVHGSEHIISSQATADPTFAFDQSAFDLYAASQNQPTFNLAEAFAFEFSESVTVPEPTIALIAVLPLIALTHRRSRGRPEWK